MNGTLGATTPSTVAATTISASSTATFAAGAAGTPSITTTGDTNTGLFFPAADTIAFAEGGAESMRLDSAGNMGLGVTPSGSWLTSFSNKVMQFGPVGSINSLSASTTNNQTFFSSNVIDQGGATYSRINADWVTRYTQNSGNHVWQTSTTQTGAVSISDLMTLNASGNLGIGTTSITSGGGWTPRLVLAASSGSPAWIIKGASNQELSIGASESMYIDCLGATTGANNNIIFRNTSTNSSFTPVERARIDSSGNLLVGTTNANPATTGVTGIVLGPTGGIRQSSGSGASYFAVTSTSGTHIQFYTYNSGAVAAGFISSSGSTTTYAASSDYRLKDIEGPVIGAKDFIMALQPKQGTWKADGSKFVGFLAHEFQEVSPSSVIGVKDAVDEDGNPIMQAMQASSAEVMANLIALVQEQQALITQLTARITALESA
jgi:hypothetical protein